MIRPWSLRRAIWIRVLTLYKKYGWKAVVGIFAYYLVRDVTLYILIPFYVFRSLTHSPQ